MARILVTCGTFGLGKFIVHALQRDNHEVISFDKKYGQDATEPAEPPPAQLDVLINCAGVNLTEWALPELIKTRGTVLNILAEPHLFAHGMMRECAADLTKKHGIIVFGISPNKMKNIELSTASAESAPLAGEETDPAQLAEFIAFLLSNKPRHKYLTGCVLPYGL